MGHERDASGNPILHDKWEFQGTGTPEEEANAWLAAQFPQHGEGARSGYERYPVRLWDIVTGFTSPADGTQGKKYELDTTGKTDYALASRWTQDPGEAYPTAKIGLMADVPGFDQYVPFNPQPTGDTLVSLLDEFDRIRFLPSGRIEYRRAGSVDDIDLPLGEWMTAEDIHFELNLQPAQYASQEEAWERAYELNTQGQDQYEAFGDPETGLFGVRPVKGGIQADPTDRFWHDENGAQAEIFAQGLSQTHRAVHDGNVWRIQPIPQATDGNIVPGEDYGLPEGSFVVIQPDGSISPFRFGDMPLENPEFKEGPDGRQYMRGRTDDPWRLVSEKNMTFEQLMTNALTDQSLSPDQQIATAMRYWNFKNQPTDKQRLDAALQLATSPADYLTLMAISRGEVEPIVSNPFDATGKLQRVAPMAGFLQDAAQKFFGTFGTEVAAGAEAGPPAPAPAGLPVEEATEAEESQAWLEAQEAAQAERDKDRAEARAWLEAQEAKEAQEADEAQAWLEAQEAQIDADTERIDDTGAPETSLLDQRLVYDPVTGTYVHVPEEDVPYKPRLTATTEGGTSFLAEPFPGHHGEGWYLDERTGQIVRGTRPEGMMDWSADESGFKVEYDARLGRWRPIDPAMRGRLGTFIGEDDPYGTMDVLPPDPLYDTPAGSGSTFDPGRLPSFPVEQYYEPPRPVIRSPGARARNLPPDIASQIAADMAQFDAGDMGFNPIAGAQGLNIPGEPGPAQSSQTGTFYTPPPYTGWSIKTRYGAQGPGRPVIRPGTVIGANPQDLAEGGSYEPLPFQAQADTANFGGGSLTGEEAQRRTRQKLALLKRQRKAVS